MSNYCTFPLTCYIAGPYRAKYPYQVKQNIDRAWNIGIEVAKTGLIYPVIPHSNSMFMEGVGTSKYFLDGTLALARQCDIQLMLPGYKNSEGSMGELEDAKRLSRPIFYNIEEIREFLDFLFMELEQNAFIDGDWETKGKFQLYPLWCIWETYKNQIYKDMNKAHNEIKKICLKYNLCISSIPTSIL